MATESTTRVTSRGTCSFCKGEFGKGQMTQHLLRYCKQRVAAIAAEEQDTTKQKTRLFHLIVEGQYNPQYWMHLELPASEPLDTLDSFLRRIWLECCGHLSAFKIGDTKYSSERMDFHFVEVSQVRGQEEEYEEDEESDVVHGEEVLAQLPQEYLESVPSDVLAELRKSWSVYDLVDFLKEKRKSIPKGDYPRTLEEWEEARRQYYYEQTLRWLLDMVEDRSLYVPLEKVVKVGQKFFHEYDFGSTTYLALRVISEREGLVRDEEHPVEILARNIVPGIRCSKCGKPATKIVAGYYNEEDAYCDTCAEEGQEYEMVLPVVNSPRVGVCGYTGH